MIPGHADIYKILVSYGLVNQFVFSKRRSKIWRGEVVYLVLFLYISDCLSVFLMLFMYSRHIFLIV